MVKNKNKNRSAGKFIFKIKNYAQTHEYIDYSQLDL
jgi:hypothetical protein